MAKAPAKEFRLGLIKATIWENASKHGTTHTVSFCRLYKNGSEWKESLRFGRDDLLLVAKLSDLAHSWVYQTQQAG